MRRSQVLCAMPAPMLSMENSCSKNFVRERICLGVTSTAAVTLSPSTAVSMASLSVSAVAAVSPRSWPLRTAAMMLKSFLMPTCATVCFMTFSSLPRAKMRTHEGGDASSSATFPRSTQSLSLECTTTFTPLRAPVIFTVSGLPLVMAPWPCSSPCSRPACSSTRYLSIWRQRQMAVVHSSTQLSASAVPLRSAIIGELMCEKQLETNSSCSTWLLHAAPSSGDL
mmetsp:Transcript_15005/g.58767  ORF Transcript_15005/g.58767 Transcript_15005/m.58767 type:complete len:225 (+) Transcript_15005:5989-6663(+)